MVSEPLQLRYFDGGAGEITTPYGACRWDVGGLSVANRSFALNQMQDQVIRTCRLCLSTFFPSSERELGGRENERKLFLMPIGSGID